VNATALPAGLSSQSLRCNGLRPAVKFGLAHASTMEGRDSSAPDQPILIALGTTDGMMRASLKGEVKQSFHFLVRSFRNRASRMSEARPASLPACTSCSHARYCSGYSFRRQSGQTPCENFAWECVCR
jgi:hypothetical protein